MPAAPVSASSAHDRVSDESYRARRDARYAALRTVWRITHQKRLAYCRRVPNGDGIRVLVRGVPGEPGARAGLSGVQTCGSVWGCPVCSEIVNSERQREIAAGLEAWLAGDERSVSMVTLTVRHNRGQALASLWDSVADTWRRLLQSVAWRGGKRVGGITERFDVVGSLRLVEVTHGRNGWHPHLHVLLFHDRAMSDEDRAELRDRLFGKWAALLGKFHGLGALDFDHTGQAVGVDVRPVLDSTYVADYFAKNGYRPAGTSAQAAAFEVTGSHAKRAGAGRTPFELLAGIVADDEAWVVMPDGVTWVDRFTGEVVDAARAEQSSRDIELWREWERTCKGRRQLTWSRGLRDLLGLGVEAEDSEVVDNVELSGHDAELDGETPITDSEYRSLIRPVISQLLRAAETDELGHFLRKLRASASKRDNSGCHERDGKQVWGRQRELSRGLG